MEVKKESPNNGRSKPLDLNEVEMIGSPHSRRSAGVPDVHHIADERKQGKESQLNPSHPDSDVETVPTQPLLEPDRGRQKPPLAGPEIDDLDGDEKPTNGTHPYPGIDDGLLDTDEKKPNGIDGRHGEFDPDVDNDHKNGDGATDDGNWRPQGDEVDYPYGDLHTLVYDTHHAVNGFGGFPDRPISPMPGSIPDVNTYQQKKNLAQGMMDLALLSANANQLRYVLESSSTHPYFYPSLVFISCSIILQIAVGVGLIMNSRYNVKDDKDICKADKINNMTVLGVFLVTIVNVFITSFSVATPNTTTTAVQTIGTG